MTDAELQRLLVLDDAPGPALPIDAWRANEIIEAALDGAGFGPSGGPSSSSGGKASPPSGASTGAAVGTKLAVVAAVVIVVAAIVLFMTRGRRGNGQVAPPPIPDAAIDSSVGSGTLAVAPDAAPEVVAEDIVIDEPPPPQPTQKEPAPPRPKPKRDESPADLLGEANAKRAAKQWRESDALYARVVESAPKTLAAQTALIASASLRLEHLGDPKGALQRFRRALAIAPKGALAEDARWGIVEATRAIGDRAAEAAALDEFLAKHASSPLAPRAKARRAELP
jgi:tetratricopeptide (TPR) repeat protein